MAPIPPVVVVPTQITTTAGHIILLEKLYTPAQKSGVEVRGHLVPL